MSQRKANEYVSILDLSIFMTNSVYYFQPPPPLLEILASAIVYNNYEVCFLYTIDQFHNVFKLMVFLLLMASDEPFHSPASFNTISIAGMHFAYISCC